MPAVCLSAGAGIGDYDVGSPCLPKPTDSPSGTERHGSAGAIALPKENTKPLTTTLSPEYRGEGERHRKTHCWASQQWHPTHSLRFAALTQIDEQSGPPGKSMPTALHPSHTNVMDFGCSPGPLPASRGEGVRHTAGRASSGTRSKDWPSLMVPSTQPPIRCAHPD